LHAIQAIFLTCIFYQMVLCSPSLLNDVKTKHLDVYGQARESGHLHLQSIQNIQQVKSYAIQTICGHSIDI
jgi:hypothetical protein